jgi:N-acetyl-anhydromuramoyl-L-alanine amidase
MHHAEQTHDLPVTMFEKGWYKFARHLASPNFGLRPADTQINLIVIHSISLPPGKYGGDEVQQLFSNTLDWNAHPYFDQIRDTKVSAHFYISRNGELWQFVSCDDRAWHAGQSSYLGKDNCNDFSIGIELEGLEGGTFELSQYDTLSSVCSALQQAYPIAYFAGHEHVASGRKADPGAGFDWQKFQRSAGCKKSSMPIVN